MLTLQELNELSEININSIERSSLTDVRWIKQNDKFSRTERFLNYLNEVKNPYCFCCDDIAVKISFASNARTLQEIFTNFLITKKLNSRI